MFGEPQGPADSEKSTVVERADVFAIIGVGAPDAMERLMSDCSRGSGEEKQERKCPEKGPAG